MLLPPAGASASTLSVSGGTAQYTAAPSEANHLVISFSYSYYGSGYYVFTDTGVSSIAVSGTVCHSYSPQVAYCQWGSVSSIAAHLGDGGSYGRNALTMTPVTIYAGGGDDILVGGAGPATLVAGPGHDTYTGGAGNETITSRNGVAEQVSCGAGTDQVVADPGDTVAADCEQVDRGAAPQDPASSGASTGGGSTPAPSAPPAGAPAVGAPLGASALGAPLALTPSGVLPVKVACPSTATGGCHGTVSVSLQPAGRSGKLTAARRRKVVLRTHSKSFSIEPGKTATVRLPLDRRSVRIFRSRKGGSARTRRFKATVTISTSTEAGIVTSTRAVRIVAGSPRRHS